MGYLTEILENDNLSTFNVKDELKASRIDLDEVYQPQPILLSH